jgi:hypothetical protein
VKKNKFVYHVRSNLPMRSTLLGSRLYLKVTFFLSNHWTFHRNWTPFKRSPFLKDHFSLSQRWPLNTYLTTWYTWFITWFVTRVTQWTQLVEQDLLTYESINIRLIQSTLKIQKGQSKGQRRETSNIVYMRWRQIKTKAQ